MKPVVIKRDGCRVPFNTKRIKEAVLSAAESVEAMNEAYAASVADGVLSQFLSVEEVDIHAIQDAVENHLMVGHIKKLPVPISSIDMTVTLLVRKRASSMVKFEA